MFNYFFISRDRSRLGGAQNRASSGFQFLFRMILNYASPLYSASFLPSRRSIIRHLAKSRNPWVHPSWRGTVWDMCLRGEAPRRGRTSRVIVRVVMVIRCYFRRLPSRSSNSSALM